MMQKNSQQEQHQKLCTFSALAIIAQQNIQSIQQIRKAHDPAFKRWQPHINICFPFVNPQRFEEVFIKLQKEFSDFPSFKIIFKEVDFFIHGTSYLVPETEPKNVLDQIHNKVIKILPECKENRDFKPHMTLGKFNKKQVQQKSQELQSIWNQWVIECNCLHMIQRQKETPFQTAKKIVFKK